MTYAEWFARAKDVGESSPDSGVDTSQPFAQSAWVHASVNLIARTAAAIPFGVLDRGGKDVTTREIAGLAQQPNPEQDISQFVTEGITQVLLDGMVFALRSNLAGMRPGEVRIRRLDKVAPDVRQNRLGDDYAPRWMNKATGEYFLTNDELFPWRLHNPYDDVYGLAPLSPGALALYCDVATGVYNRQFFENGARPGIVFTSEHPGFNQEQANEAKAMWDSKHKGARRGHQAAFLGNGLKPHTIGYTYSDMEFPALKAMSKAEILAIYGVPDSMLGSQDKGGGVQIGGSGRRPEEENFILNTVMFWAGQFCRWYDRAVLKPYGEYRSYFDWRQVPILQDRLLQRAKEGREWVKAGATFNDVNTKFGLDFEKQVTGDDWWVPSNMLPARLLMEGPIAAKPDKDHRDSADAKDAKKSLRLIGEAA